MNDNKKLLQELEGETVKGSSLLLFLIVFILSTLLYWAYVTELDVVIRGQGKTISEGKNQMVQSAESGVITKSFVKEGDKIKTIRFGEQGASTAGKPKAGETAKMKAKRKSFKARHRRNIAKGKMSAAYWADKVKW